MVPAPLDCIVPQIVHTFRCNCALRVLNHPLFVTHVHCLLFRKKGVSQGSDGGQISLICLPALRADGGQISLICLLTNMFTALSRSV